MKIEGKNERRQVERAITRGIIVFLGCLPVVNGCRVPLENVRASLRRHVEAMERLPQERGMEPLRPSSVMPGDQLDGVLVGGVLTLEAARAVAIRKNPGVHAARARLEASLARVAEARASFFPTVSFKHTSTRTFQNPPSRPRLTSALQAFTQTPTVGNPEVLESIPPLFRPLFEPLFGLGGLKSNTNSFSDHSTALIATWTVFDGFVRESQLLSAKHLYRATDMAQKDVERLIVQAVDAIYHRTQLAAEQLRIARADVEFSREQLEVTEKLLAAERATRTDVANFRIRMLTARASVTAAIGLQGTARTLLAELMGLSGAVLPENLKVSPLAREIEEATELPRIETWIERAMRNRPDFAQFQAVLESATQNVRTARGAFSPMVGISGSWGFDRDGNLGYSIADQSSVAGMELRWDIYTGGGRRARLRVAASARAEATANLNRARLAVEAGVRRAIIAIQDAREQIGLRKESLQTARETRRLVQVAYLAGREDLTRLNETQRDFIGADANLALARIRLRQAISDLYAEAAWYPGGSGDETDGGS